MIKDKSFYYKENENCLVFVNRIYERSDGVKIVFCSKVNTDEHFNYYASTFLDNYKLVGYICE